MFLNNEPTEEIILLLQNCDRPSFLSIAHADKSMFENFVEDYRLLEGTSLYYEMSNQAFGLID